MSSDYFSKNIVDIAQETEGSCHPSPVNEVHYFSLSILKVIRYVHAAGPPKLTYLSSKEEIRPLSLINIPKNSKWVVILGWKATTYTLAKVSNRASRSRDIKSLA